MPIGKSTNLKLIEKKIIHEKIVFRQFHLSDTLVNVSKTIDHFEFSQPFSNNDHYETDQCIPLITPNDLIEFLRLMNEYGDTTNRFLTVHSESVEQKSTQICSISFCLELEVRVVRFLSLL